MSCFVIAATPLRLHALDKVRGDGNS
jgi:hypothetical protein